MNEETPNETRSAIERCDSLMSQWRSERNSPSFDPVPLLNQLSELLEEQINIFFSTDPDPFDDRHPLRTDSSCDLGQLLRSLSTHESFLERVTFVYLVGSNDPSDRLVVAASRLLCAMRLGVTLSFTLDEEDTTINALYKLAMSDCEPTNCYALFLLGSVLDNTELLYITRQKNMQLIPIVVNRLVDYTAQLKTEISAGINNLLGGFQLTNLTVEMKIRLSIAYLLPLAEYQDLMPFMYNGGILELIYVYVSREAAARDIRLTFEALRLLGSLMCHRCVYLEFVEKEGLRAVLKVPRPSVAATAVSVVLYYTAYFEDAMERVCQMPVSILTDLIKYALWLVECSHPSARCYSLFFINLVVCYGVPFELFEAQNGLVYLYNAICVLPLRLTEDNPQTLKDTTSWHVVRASLFAIRRFLEISLLLWIDKVDPSLSSLFDEPPRAVAAAGYRPITFSSEQFSRLLTLLIARIRPDTVWQPTQQLKECGAISVLYRIIARNVYAHNSWPCRNECTRLAVDILNLMCITYDLADEIASANVFSFPTGISTAAFLSTSPLFSSLNAVGDSPRSAAGSADVTVHLPSPNGPGLGRSERGGLINQLLEIVEQVGGSSTTGSWDFGSRRTGANSRRARPRNELRDRAGASGDGNETPADGRSTAPGDRVPPARGASGSDAAAAAATGDDDPMISASETDERVNGLHMLFSISREDDGWDVAVHKSVLAFICTLVYRPITEHEHPDNPIPATTVLSQLPGSIGPGASNMSPPPASSGTVASTGLNSYASSRLGTPPFKAPHRSSVLSSGRLNRKRRYDELTTQPLFITSLPLDGPISQPTTPPLSSQASPVPRHSVCPSVTNIYSESGIPVPIGRQPQTRLLYRQACLWSIVRRQHGLMALLYHLETKQPISEADSIRTLACRGLVGLARSEEVRSMLAKMPLFTKALLQLLMKEPILPDRLTEHAEFCRYATMLIRLVVGTLSDGVLSGDMSLERVRRAEIVAKTRIQWDHEELLELIYRHLLAKGLHESAETLQREARLKVIHNAPSQLPLYDDFSRPPGETPPYQPTPGSVSTDLNSSLTVQEDHPVGNNVTDLTSQGELVGPGGDSTAEVPPTPNLRLVKVRSVTTPAVQTPKPYRDRFERPSIPNMYLKPISHQPVPEMTLSKVVESFLLHQHAQCPHPVSVCPKFSLYHPHRCPEPRPNKQSNFCQRFLSRESLFGSLRLRPSRREDRHFLHRRFQPTAVIREAEDDLLTACCFSLTDDGLFLGATSGAIAWVNVEEDGMPVELFHVQTSSIRRLAHTRDGERLLVCSEWGEPATVVAQLRPSSGVGSGNSNNSPWEAVAEDFVFHVSEARYAEFSNTGLQDRLVATYGKMAKVFDLTTGTRVADLFSAVKQSGYVLNKATFSPSDQLVLNDGVIWDLRCTGTLPAPSGSLHSGYFNRPVHKIDKLQDIVSGVFHPNGLEIIVGSAVWDVRTWRLLHTIQALDRLEVQFNATKDVIYAGTFGLDDEEYTELGNSRFVMPNMFRTVDALDYNLIASVNVRHRIEQLALDTTGQSLALVEKVGENSSNESITQCRIYMVGRKRSEREPDNEEEEGREDDDDDDDDDNDDDDDDDEDLLNAETADELAQILDGSSSGNDDASSDWSDWSAPSSDRVRPPRRSRRIRVANRARNAETAGGENEGTGDGASNAPANGQNENTDEPMDRDGTGEEGNSVSSWETLEEEEASDESILTEDD
ncbi:HIV-1 Vpr-binding protein [Fasciola hepatica]|uniref:HIV-1 Vpr-binding protein n=1 Tax=Fasciola hepatica TaxID=6192 RepID=A0A4E0R5Y4_FASHE|nr:HIV-1 Vpr-binding protein [Fasciola hepatica]